MGRVSMLKLVVAALAMLSAPACGDDPGSNGQGGDGDGDTAGDGDGDTAGDGDSAGDGDGDGDGDLGGDAGPGVMLELLPWKEGNSWTYRTTNNGVVSEKTTTVGPLEPVGGTGPYAALLANKVTTKKGEMDQTISWQALIDGRVVRYREQSFGASDGLLELEEHWDPPKLHIDSTEEHMAAGAMWLEIYLETKTPVDTPAITAEARDVWIVDGVDQEITVPAGTFNAIVLQKAGGSSTKTYWYVPGVGKVLETGGQTEELLSYEVHP